ncbi:MAG: hypothetical protein ABIN48_13225 [Ginsengibacter sp.]
MKNNKEILNELKTISSLLASIPKVNVQSVPPGYFENLEEKLCIFSKLNQDAKESFKDEDANIPEGYFETLSDSILSRINNNEAKELEETFPILNSLKDKNVFHVPAGYFENLNDQIITRIKPKEKAKVISINSWMKYVAAAVIAGIMLFTSLYIFSPGGNEISKYLAASQQYETSGQIAAGLASLNENEIINYLERNGNITDNDLLLKNIDTEELPTEFEYLIDDNTLNKFLDKINIEKK